jgi:hypothetical protein
MDGSWEAMLNDNSADANAGNIISAVSAVPAFSLEQVESVAPKTAFEKLRFLAQQKAAKRDKFFIDSIGQALETEVSLRKSSRSVSRSQSQQRS